MAERPDDKKWRQGFRKVGRITQSPMNPAIWFLDLECGHEARVVQKARPARESLTRDKATGELMSSARRVKCPTCATR